MRFPLPLGCWLKCHRGLKKPKFQWPKTGLPFVKMSFFLSSVLFCPGWEGYTIHIPPRAGFSGVLAWGALVGVHARATLLLLGRLCPIWVPNGFHLVVIWFTTRFHLVAEHFQSGSMVVLGQFCKDHDRHLSGTCRTASRHLPGTCRTASRHLPGKFC